MSVVEEKTPVPVEVDSPKPEDDGTAVDPWSAGDNIDYNKLVSYPCLCLFGVV